MPKTKLYYYTYIRPQNSTHQYPDPPYSMDDVDFELTQTALVKDDSREFLCYIDSDDNKIWPKLEAETGFEWVKINNINQATTRCNNNITHLEWEEFTNDWIEVVDNRVREH